MTINEPFIPGILFEFFSKCTIYTKYKKRVKVYSLIAFSMILLVSYIIKAFEYRYFKNAMSVIQALPYETILLLPIVITFFEFKPNKSFEIVMIEKILSKLSDIMIGLVFIKGYSLDHKDDEDKSDTLYLVMNRETSHLKSLISALLDNSNNTEFKNEYDYLINAKKLENYIDLLNKNILDLLTKLQNFNHCEDFDHAHIYMYTAKFLDNTDNYDTNIYFNSIFGLSDHWIWHDKLGIRHNRNVIKRKWLCNKLDGVQTENKKSKKSENPLEWIDKI